jgi:hypothetical protein
VRRLPVVHPGIQGSRAACTDDDGEAGSRPTGYGQSKTHVVADHAKGGTVAVVLAFLTAYPEKRIDNRFVPQVQEAVMHVQNGRVDDTWDRRRFVVRPGNAEVADPWVFSSRHLDSAFFEGLFYWFHP